MVKKIRATTVNMTMLYAIIIRNFLIKLSLSSKYNVFDFNYNKRKNTFSRLFPLEK